MDSKTRFNTTEIDRTINNQTFRSHSDNLTNISTIEKTRLRRSTDIIEPINKTNTISSSEFDVQHVYEAFISALREVNHPKSPIGTRDYINGYRELLKFFDQLGYVFKFVKDDVVQKLAILQSFIDNDKKSVGHFDTIQNAIHYETTNNLIKTNPENFTRTLLRLHRALLFIVEFLRGLTDLSSSESTAVIANSCYDLTLSNHHGYFIRKSVKIGFRILPSRKQLNDAIFHGHKDELFDQYKIFIKTIKQIYDIIEDYYTEKKYLQLP